MEAVEQDDRTGPSLLLPVIGRARDLCLESC